METNVIIEELKARATLDWNPEQKAYFVKMAEDARPVQCVRMRDVFTPEQMRFLRIHYHARMKECYKNATDLVLLCKLESSIFPEPVKYVEGFAYSLPYSLLTSQDFARVIASGKTIILKLL